MAEHSMPLSVLNEKEDATAPKCGGGAWLHCRHGEENSQRQLEELRLNTASRIAGAMMGGGRGRENKGTR